jgi:hypothetical protein
MERLSGKSIGRQTKKTPMSISRAKEFAERDSSRR